MRAVESQSSMGHTRLQKLTSLARN